MSNGLPPLRDGAAEVDLLQRDDVGRVAPDQLDHAREIEARIAADRAVDVPGHQADGAAQDALLQSRDTSACTPNDTAIQTDHRKREHGHLGQRRIADDRDDPVAERRHHDQPRQHAEQGAGHVVDQLDRAGARRQVDDGERRHRHDADRGDREHALALDPGADAVEPRPSSLAQRALAELRAERIGRERARQHAERRIERSRTTARTPPRSPRSGSPPETPPARRPRTRRPPALPPRLLRAMVRSQSRTLSGSAQSASGVTCQAASARRAAATTTAIFHAVAARRPP